MIVDIPPPQHLGWLSAARIPLKMSGYDQTQQEEREMQHNKSSWSWDLWLLQQLENELNY